MARIMGFKGFTSADRHHLLLTGTAAGVAAGFSAAIAGVFFALGLLRARLALEASDPKVLCKFPLAYISQLRNGAFTLQPTTLKCRWSFSSSNVHPRYSEVIFNNITRGNARVQDGRTPCST
jgi:H+/Cl- antiporter ClcA